MSIDIASLGRLEVVDERDGVRILKLVREEKLNALNSYLWERLSEELRRACKDDNVRVLVITGTGRAFSVGDDIYEMYDLKTRVEARNFFEIVEAAVRELVECPKPVIAAVEGYAYGGGFELLLACDVVIASRSARFSAPEARIGLFPPLLSTLGVLVLGLRKARMLALTTVELSAEEARDIGIVDRVVEDGRALEEALTIARMLALIPSESYEPIKKLSLEVLSTLEGALNEALRKLEEMVVSETGKKYMALFIEERRKRKQKGG